ncbi:MAG: hypothetical protein ACOZQL_32955 [Myxococcota bacterium]
MRRLTLLLSVCFAAVALADEPFNALARRHQPIPAGHVVGKDNGAGAGLHNAGEDCGICHTPGGKAERFVFTIAGTVYADRMGTRPLAGAEIVLEDAKGGVLSMTSNGVGNFWSTSPLASNGLAVASHGGATHELFGFDGGVLVEADPGDSRTWQYKAWLRHGEQVRHMVTIAPVGGSTGTVPRMSCNMHHAPLGGSGALWVGRETAPAAAVEANVSFRRDVQPLFVSRCAPCHLPGKRFTRLVTASDVADAGATSFDYSAGLDLTSWGGSAVAVTEGGVTTTWSKQGIRGVCDPLSPAQSRALQKTLLQPAGNVVHAGGGFWTPADPEYRTILSWIEAGALDN